MGTQILRVLLATLALTLASGRADALVVTYDLGSNQGPITLRFEADDADTRIRFRGGEADVSGLLDVTLIFGGETFTLLGAVDPDVSMLNARDRSLTMVVAEVVRPWADTLTTVRLTFSSRMNRIRTLGDLFAYLGGARVTGGNLTIARGDAVPLPAGAWVMLTGLGALALSRRTASCPPC